MENGKKFLCKLVFMLLPVFLLIGLLAGCGTGEKGDGAVPAPVEATPENPPAAAAPVLQELVIGEQFDLRGYDPAKNMSDFVRSLVFNNLVELDLDFKQGSSGLAEKWEMEPDGRTWTFYLRQGVTFHDGMPWNAEAAIINLDRLRHGPGQGWIGYIDSIEEVDNYTITVHLKQPVFTFASDLTPPFQGMVSPAALNEDGDAIEAIGTGPFKLTSWEKDSQFVMERNEAYFEGAPVLEKITFKVIPDAETRALALQAGQIHMMSGREALTVVQRFLHNPEINVVKKMGQTSEVIFFNTYREPFDNLLVRHAVATALDWDVIVPQLLEGVAEPPQNFFAPAYGEFLQSSPNMPVFNPEKAKNLLEEAGWKDTAGGIREKNGRPLKASLYLGSGNEEDKALSTVVQSRLKEIGMDVELRAVEGGALREALNEKQYDMIMIGQWMIPHDDPTTHYLRGYWHSNSTFTIYTSDKLDDMIDRLAQSMDANERLQLHREIQAEILDNVPFVVVFHRNNVMLMRQKVKDFDISTGTWQLFRGLTRARIE